MIDVSVLFRIIMIDNREEREHTRDKILEKALVVLEIPRDIILQEIKIFNTSIFGCLLNTRNFIAVITRIIKKNNVVCDYNDIINDLKMTYEVEKFLIHDSDV